MRCTLFFTLMLFNLCQPLSANEAVIQRLLQNDQQQGADSANAAAGEAFWNSDNNGRSCSQCHGSDVRLPGVHSRTKRVIEPMAPSVNSARLTDQKTIEKWLLRNCQWTLGRHCSAQEKADVLTWLSQQ